MEDSLISSPNKTLRSKLETLQEILTPKDANLLIMEAKKPSASISKTESDHEGMMADNVTSVTSVPQDMTYADLSISNTTQNDLDESLLINKRSNILQKFKSQPKNISSPTFISSTTYVKSSENINNTYNIGELDLDSDDSINLSEVKMIIKNRRKRTIKELEDDLAEDILPSKKKVLEQQSFSTTLPAIEENQEQPISRSNEQLSNLSGEGSFNFESQNKVKSRFTRQRKSLNFHLESVIGGIKKKDPVVDIENNSLNKDEISNVSQLSSSKTDEAKAESLQPSVRKSPRKTIQTYDKGSPKSLSTSQQKSSQQSPDLSPNKFPRQSLRVSQKSPSKRSLKSPQISPKKIQVTSGTPIKIVRHSSPEGSTRSPEKTTIRSPDVDSVSQDDKSDQSSSHSLAESLQLENEKDRKSRFLRQRKSINFNLDSIIAGIKPKESQSRDVEDEENQSPPVDVNSNISQLPVNENIKEKSSTPVSTRKSPRHTTPNTARESPSTSLTTLHETSLKSSKPISKSPTKFTNNSLTTPKSIHNSPPSRNLLSTSRKSKNVNKTPIKIVRKSPASSSNTPTKSLVKPYPTSGRKSPVLSDPPVRSVHKTPPKSSGKDPVASPKSANKTPIKATRKSPDSSPNTPAKSPVPSDSPGRSVLKTPPKSSRKDPVASPKSGHKSVNKSPVPSDSPGRSVLKTPPKSSRKDPMASPKSAQKNLMKTPTKSAHKSPVQQVNSYESPLKSLRFSPRKSSKRSLESPQISPNKTLVKSITPPKIVRHSSPESSTHSPEKTTIRSPDVDSVFQDDKSDQSSSHSLAESLQLKNEKERKLRFLRQRKSINFNLDSIIAGIKPKESQSRDVEDEENQSPPVDVNSNISQLPVNENIKEKSSTPVSTRKSPRHTTPNTARESPSTSLTTLHETSLKSSKPISKSPTKFTNNSLTTPKSIHNSPPSRNLLSTSRKSKNVNKTPIKIVRKSPASSSNTPTKSLVKPYPTSGRKSPVLSDPPVRSVHKTPPKSSGKDPVASPKSANKTPIKATRKSPDSSPNTPAKSPVPSDSPGRSVLKTPPKSSRKDPVASPKSGHKSVNKSPVPSDSPGRSVLKTPPKSSRKDPMASPKSAQKNLMKTPTKSAHKSPVQQVNSYESPLKSLRFSPRKSSKRSLESPQISPNKTLVKSITPPKIVRHSSPESSTHSPEKTTIRSPDVDSVFQDDKSDQSSSHSLAESLQLKNEKERKLRFLRQRKSINFNLDSIIAGIKPKESQSRDVEDEENQSPPVDVNSNISQLPVNENIKEKSSTPVSTRKSPRHTTPITARESPSTSLTTLHEISLKSSKSISKSPTKLTNNSLTTQESTHNSPPSRNLRSTPRKSKSVNKTPIKSARKGRTSAPSSPDKSPAKPHPTSARKSPVSSDSPGRSVLKTPSKSSKKDQVSSPKFSANKNPAQTPTKSGSKSPVKSITKTSIKSSSKSLQMTSSRSLGQNLEESNVGTFSKGTDNIPMPSLYDNSTELVQNSLQENLGNLHNTLDNPRKSHRLSLREGTNKSPEKSRVESPGKLSQSSAETNIKDSKQVSLSEAIQKSKGLSPKSFASNVSEISETSTVEFEESILKSKNILAGMTSSTEPKTSPDIHGSDILHLSNQVSSEKTAHGDAQTNLNSFQESPRRSSRLSPKKSPLKISSVMDKVIESKNNSPSASPKQASTRPAPASPKINLNKNSQTPLDVSRQNDLTQSPRSLKTISLTSKGSFLGTPLEPYQGGLKESARRTSLLSFTLNPTKDSLKQDVTVLKNKPLAQFSGKSQSDNKTVTEDAKKSQSDDKTVTEEDTSLKQLTLAEFLERMAKGDLPRKEKPKALESLMKEPTVLQEISQTAKPTPKKRKSTSSKQDKNLPRKMNRSVFEHFSQHRVSKEGADAFHYVVEKFWENMASDLDVVLTATRSKILNKSNVFLLMKKLNLVSSKEEMHSMMQEFLPVDVWKKIIPTMYAFNKVLPKED